MDGRPATWTCRLGGSFVRASGLTLSGVRAGMELPVPIQPYFDINLIGDALSHPCIIRIDPSRLIA